MTKALIFTSLILTLLPLSHPALALAQSEDATSSSNVDPETVKENIKKRIQKAVENNTSEMLGIKMGPIIGWVGTIESITSDSLTIVSTDTSRIVAVPTNASIVRTSAGVKKSDAKLEDLAIGDFIIAMGRVDDDDVLNTIRIVAADTKPMPITKKVVLGQITDIDSKADLITITPPNGSTPVILELTTKSALRQKDTGDKLKLTNLDPGDQIVAIYEPDSKDPETNNLLLLHRLNTPQPSPSPTPKSSSSN